MRRPPSTRPPAWLRVAVFEFHPGDSGWEGVEAERGPGGRVVVRLPRAPGDVLSDPDAAGEVARAAGERMEGPARRLLDIAGAAASFALLALAAYAGASRGLAALLVALALAVAAASEIIKAIPRRAGEAPLWLGLLAVEAARIAGACGARPCRGVTAAVGMVFEYTVKRGAGWVRVELRRRGP